MRAKRRVLILGAAGRDFHVFNTCYRDDPQVEVVAFTATQIPGIAQRRYPSVLAGAHYPDGIAIEPEAALERLCRDAGIDEVVFAYSDITHDAVMHLASRALAVGADFKLCGPRATMLGARVPVLGVSAVRTGCGKSQVARHVAQLCAAHARRVAVVRHPMPYGELAAARIQRFARRADLDAAQVTIEEREEFEPHLAAGQVVYAGVDYQAVTCAAESEADVIVWDGGNNDFPFLRPDLHIVVVDALRPEQLASHHPGEAVVRMADVCVINKVDSARPDAVATLRERLAELAPRATIVLAASPVTLDDALAIKDRRVVVVEDGPTSTHGGMAYGAGTLAARAAGAREIVDPRPYAVGTLRHAYRDYPHLGAIVPALGYDRAAVSDLAATLARVPAEVVVVGTPIDLAALVGGNKPCVRARYGYADAGTPTLAAILERRFFARAAG